MNIEIKYKKILIRGEKFCEIQKASALSRENLPEKYTAGTPLVLGRKNKELGHFLEICRGPSFSRFIAVGDRENSEDMEKILTTIRAAGNRLQKINTELKEKNKDWHGEVEVII